MSYRIPLISHLNTNKSPIGVHTGNPCCSRTHRVVENHVADARIRFYQPLHGLDWFLSRMSHTFLFWVNWEDTSGVKGFHPWTSKVLGDVFTSRFPHLRLKVMSAVSIKHDDIFVPSLRSILRMRSIRVVSFFKNQGVKLPSLGSTIYKSGKERFISRVRTCEQHDDTLWRQNTLVAFPHLRKTIRVNTRFVPVVISTPERRIAQNEVNGPRGYEFVVSHDIKAVPVKHPRWGYRRFHLTYKSRFVFRARGLPRPLF